METTGTWTRGMLVVDRRGWNVTQSNEKNLEQDWEAEKRAPHETWGKTESTHVTVVYSHAKPDLCASTIMDLVLG